MGHNFHVAGPETISLVDQVDQGWGLGTFIFIFFHLDVNCK